MKIITLEYGNLKVITRKTIELEAQKLPYDGKVSGTPVRLQAGKGVAKQLIKTVIADYKAAAKELGTGLDQDEMSDIAYMENLIK